MASPFVTGYQGFFNPGSIASIASGAQESSVINCGGMVLTGLMIPQVFTGTALTFEMGDSVDGFQAQGQIAFGGTTADADTLTIKGVVITFKNTVTVPASQVLIGASAAETAANLQAFLAATVNADLLLLTYVTVGAVTLVKAKVHGTAGNAYSFAKSSSDITLTPSGGVLAGGGFQPLYDASNSLVSMTVAQGRAYAVDPKNFQGVQFLKLKSGSSELAARSIVCTLKGF